MVIGVVRSPYSLRVRREAESTGAAALLVAGQQAGRHSSWHPQWTNAPLTRSNHPSNTQSRAGGWALNPQGSAARLSTRKPHTSRGRFSAAAKPSALILSSAAPDKFCPSSIHACTDDQPPRGERSSSAVPVRPLGRVVMSIHTTCIPQLTHSLGIASLSVVTRAGGSPCRRAPLPHGPSPRKTMRGSVCSTVRTPRLCSLARVAAAPRAHGFAWGRAVGKWRTAAWRTARARDDRERGYA